MVQHRADPAATQNPDVEISQKYEFTPVAVGVVKEPALVNAVAAALGNVITTPAYREVLEKYGLQSAAITQARVNAAQ